MRQGLHPFGQRVPVEAAGQSEHAVHDAGMLPVVQHASHEALVDLDGLRAQLLQEGER